MRAKDGKITQRGWGVAGIQLEGLTNKFKAERDIQEKFSTSDHFIEWLRRTLPHGGLRSPMALGFGGNERTRNGARQLAKQMWGLSSSPNVSTCVMTTPYTANNKTSAFNGAFTWAHGGLDLACGDGSTNGVAAGVTTNEWTSNGLSRTTTSPSAYVDPTAIDGVFTFSVVSGTFTCATGASTVYGMALFDVSSTATCNLFMESGTAASAALQIGDTLVWTTSGSA